MAARRSEGSRRTRLAIKDGRMPTSPICWLFAAVSLLSGALLAEGAAFTLAGRTPRAPPVGRELRCSWAMVDRLAWFQLFAVCGNSARVRADVALFRADAAEGLACVLLLYSHTAAVQPAAAQPPPAVPAGGRGAPLGGRGQLPALDNLFPPIGSELTPPADGEAAGPPAAAVPEPPPPLQQQPQQGALPAPQTKPEPDLTPAQLRVLRSTRLLAQASVAANLTRQMPNSTVFAPDDAVGAMFCGGLPQVRSAILLPIHSSAG